MIKVTAYFPVSWRFGDSPSDGLGGPPVEDAGSLYIDRDELADEDWPEGTPLVLHKTSLQEIVSDTLMCWSDGDGRTHEDHVPSSDALAAALRLAADTLDAAKP